MENCLIGEGELVLQLDFCTDMMIIFEQKMPATKQSLAQTIISKA